MEIALPVTEQLEKPRAWDGGGGPPPRDVDGGHWGDNEDEGAHRVPARAYKTLIWLAMAAMMMFFVALSSAYIIRRGISEDWVSTALPHILALNTLILVASSVSIWFAGRALRVRNRILFVRLLIATLMLGLGFLFGQLIAWRQLVSAGVYISANPSSAFFYVLTAAHGVHLIGGLIGLGYVLHRTLQGYLHPSSPIAFEVASTYWHFLDGAWLYLFGLLMFWR